MARSAAQSDFSVSRAPEIRLAGSAELVDPPPGLPSDLPSGDHSSFASALATRWVLRLTAVLLFALAVLCAVGPHIPAGE